jgi:hypothetical protein
MIPRPPWEVGRVNVSHLTFTLALVAFPLHGGEEYLVRH